MTVQIILLNYQRKEFTDKVKAQNLNNANYPFSLLEVDMKGISAAFNYGLSKSLDFDAVVFMANDILLPNDWLRRMVLAAQDVHNTGCVGIYCVESGGEQTVINKTAVRLVPTAFGSTLYPMEAIKKVGGYNPEYDPYGMQDADYALRLSMAGFISYYLDGLKAEHIGHDVGNGTEYRKMKDDSLKAACETWTRCTTYYKETGNYTIDIPEWP